MSLRLRSDMVSKVPQDKQQNIIRDVPKKEEIGFLLRAYINRKVTQNERIEIIKEIKGFAASLLGLDKNLLNVKLREGSLEIFIYCIGMTALSVGAWVLKKYIETRVECTAKDDHAASVAKKADAAMKTSQSQLPVPMQRPIDVEYDAVEANDVFFGRALGYMHKFSLSEFELVQDDQNYRNRLLLQKDPEGNVKAKVHITDRRSETRSLVELVEMPEKR